VRALAAELAAEEQDRRLLARLEEIWLLRAEVDPQVPGFALRKSLRAYPPAFAEHGLRVETDTKGPAAWVLRRPPPTRERLIAGLDAWLGLARQLKAPEADWLFGVLQAADGDDWRKGLRAAVARNDVKEVERLARPEELARHSPQTVLLLADYFRPRSQDRMIALLRAAQARFPADFWLNFALADALYQKHFTALAEAPAYEDVVRFFAMAQALRPDNLHVQTLLGYSLWLRGRRAEGRAALEQIAARRPDYFGAPLYLGYMSLFEGADDEAEKAFRRALALQPRSGMAQAGLGFALWGRGQYAEGLLALRRGNRLEPFPRVFLGQAGLLGPQGRMDEAGAVYRQALKFQPDFDEAQVALRLVLLMEARRTNEGVTLCRGLVLVRPNQPEPYLMLNRFLCAQGRWAEALSAARSAQELAPKGPVFPVALLSLFVRETERFRDLEPHLPAYVKGDLKARDAEELSVLITLCWIKQQYAGATRLYAHAFAADPGLAEDVTDERRYDAARYATQAGGGQGDGAGLDEAERARWRKQALDWLRADLAGWRKLLEGGKDDDRALAGERLRWWLEDPKFAVLRDAAALEKLPADEREAWRKVWADVTALAEKGLAEAGR
jgi:tetratricopeptide (TPR) repeat protein